MSALGTDGSSAMERARQAARRAYEVARLRRGLVRALLVAVVLATLAVTTTGSSALALLPVFVLAWTSLEWRGGPLLHGGRAGAVGGVVAMIVPMSMMETCCRAGCAMTAGTCCKMAGGCLAVGALLGLAVAAWLARTSREQDRLRAAAGAAIGLVATACPRCTEMMLGEGLGLLGGLVAGMMAATLVTVVVQRRPRATT